MIDLDSVCDDERLVEIDAWECPCQEFGPEEERDDMHLQCKACGAIFHGDAEYLEPGDPCPVCTPPGEPAGGVVDNFEVQTCHDDVDVELGCDESPDDVDGWLRRNSDVLRRLKIVLDGDPVAKAVTRANLQHRLRRKGLL